MSTSSDQYNIVDDKLEPPTRPTIDRIFDLLLWGTIALLLITSFVPVEMYKIPRLFSNSENMQVFGSRFIHPNFTELPTYIRDMIKTIQIALWGTFLSIIFAVPLGFMTASNVAPGWLVMPMRRVMDFLRSVDGLVMGTIFLVAVGLGPLAGVLAIAFNTAGVLGKLFSEAVEASDGRPVEGVRATGALKLHEIKWGILPQVSPLWTSFALYRFESNARSATVLGLIGAGGIGQSLFESINAFKHEETSAIVIVIIVAVSLIDLLSQLMRSRLL